MIMQFVKVCDGSEIAEGSLKTFVVNDKPVLLAKFEGRIYAVDNICTHDGGDLSLGDIVKGQVQCPRHGARFDLKTGQATRMPAVFGINAYEIKIENGEVLIALPE